MGIHLEVNWDRGRIDRRIHRAHPRQRYRTDRRYAPCRRPGRRPGRISRSRCTGVTASLDAVSAVAADCALSVTAAASPDATAGAFGAVSAGPVGEAAGGGASPGAARGALSEIRYLDQEVMPGHRRLSLQRR
jgi:hypothetical protein